MSDSMGKRAAAVAAAIVGAAGAAIDTEARRRHDAGSGDPGLDREAIQDRFDDRLRDRVSGEDGARNIWDDWFDNPNGGGNGGGGNGGGGGNLNWFPFS